MIGAMRAGSRAIILHVFTLFQKINAVVFLVVHDCGRDQRPEVRQICDMHSVPGSTPDGGTLFGMILIEGSTQRNVSEAA